MAVAGREREMGRGAVTGMEREGLHEAREREEGMGVEREGVASEAWAVMAMGVQGQRAERPVLLL